VDGYHWADMIAEAASVRRTMNLAPPGPDPFQTTRQLKRLRSISAPHRWIPFSIDADGSNLHGVVYDHVRLIAVAARAAAASGIPLDPNRLPQRVANPHLVLISGRIVCSGETIAPDSVRLTDSSGNEPRAIGTGSGAKIADLSPGLAGRTDAAAIAVCRPDVVLRRALHAALCCP